jgi:hypothetical protein
MFRLGIRHLFNPRSAVGLDSFPPFGKTLNELKRRDLAVWVMIFLNPRLGFDTPDGLFAMASDSQGFSALGCLS